MPGGIQVTIVSVSMLQRAYWIVLLFDCFPQYGLPHWKKKDSCLIV